jgi:hypothetical protein
MLLCLQHLPLFFLWSQKHPLPDVAAAELARQQGLAQFVTQVSKRLAITDCTCMQLAHVASVGPVNVLCTLQANAYKSTLLLRPACVYAHKHTLLLQPARVYAVLTQASTACGTFCRCDAILMRHAMVP